LKGKTALVSGGVRGIGAGIVFELGKRGVDVIVLHSPNGAHLADGIRRKNSELPHKPRTFSVCGDLRVPEEIKQIMGSVVSWLGKHQEKLTIDILVNNAGVELVKPLGDITPEEIDNIYNTNVRDPVLLTQAVLPYLPKCGRIINIGSVGSRAAFPGLSIYCSSKAALGGLTRCWAVELGGNGTTVNMVNPGPVQSEMLDNIPKEIIEGQKKATPIENRVGTVEEVASVVVWLAGEESRWVTGQTISASGGWAMY